MSTAPGTLEDVLRNIDLDIQRLRAERERIETELQTAEESKRYILSVAKGTAHVRGQVSLAKFPKSINQQAKPSRGLSGTSQRQNIIDLATAILLDRDNQPIRRDELWAEMQARGLQLRNSNPTHYIASKVLGSAKDIFGNEGGYFLLGHPRPSAGDEQSD
ncbi:hypothetical protein CN059_29090 [Sinorhizobium medicae]|uniref:hypothetical protein n=1 Tax=Sinorhizobium medicae TaxID=110321 RepID=UPI000C79A331|nr:hypothetical protein [Sinorhizobium medicae]MDX1016399.1 hypothetical protein [Sinorhizobium medicae]PLU50755.1 hypothetical protein BMJ25_06655 [Sinorhizobium medicae]RVQ40998.1 hypothetical protein CN059_29090 [Sinorhizobium medicae]